MKTSQTEAERQGNADAHHAKVKGLLHPGSTASSSGSNSNNGDGSPGHPGHPHPEGTSHRLAK